MKKIQNKHIHFYLVSEEKKRGIIQQVTYKVQHVYEAKGMLL